MDRRHDGTDTGAMKEPLSMLARIAASRRATAALASPPGAAATNGPFKSLYESLEESMKRFTRLAVAALVLSAVTPSLAQQGPIPIVGLVELSGTGTTAGTISTTASSSR